MSQAPPLIAGLDAAAAHEAQTMSRKLCVAAALLCVIVVLVSAQKNDEILAKARDFGMFTATIFAICIMLLLHMLATIYLFANFWWIRLCLSSRKIQAVAYAEKNYNYL